MPEERGLYPKMRVAHQRLYTARLHGVEPADAAAAAERWIARLGLEGRIHDRVEELSLGNQQRVQLGSALVHDPELLVLDEPFSGLDPGGVDVLSGVLSERTEEGVTVLFSSHQLELVERLCSVVAIVNDGRLVASGEVDELRSREAGRALRVEIEGADASWWEGLPEVDEVERRDGQLLLFLAEDADDQRVLDAARRAGRLRSFGPAEPTLAEVFREVVDG